MRIGIVGLPKSGKSTVFRAAAGSFSVQEDRKGHICRATVRVPDPRLETLQRIFQSSKITPAQIEYLDVAFDLREREKRGQDLERLLNELKPAAALILVIRNFELNGLPPNPQKDLDTLHEELLLADLAVVERRIERLEKEVKKGKLPKEGELEALYRAYSLLEKGKPLRLDEDLRRAAVLRGYTFLSLKPLLIVINSGEEMTSPELVLPPASEAVEIKGRLEKELIELPAEEAQVFREEYGLEEPALPLLIRKSFEVLDLICFFTGGEKETRAWPIPKRTKAVKAAGVIHSDMEKGFIRAEVIGYEELVALGSYQAAQKAGKVRLEGKEYVVQDGDVIIFRFSV